MRANFYTCGAVVFFPDLLIYCAGFYLIFKEFTVTTNVKTDARDPAEITEKTEGIGIAKANKDLVSQSLLGALAGVYIGFGAMFYTMIKADSTLGFATAHILSGLVFSVGLILVVVAGAELFTGNNLLTIAWAQKKITGKALLRNWGIVFVSNFVGAVLLASIIYASGHPDMHHGKIAETYVKVANAKCELPFWTAFFRGIGCNILVCLGVWLAYGGRTLTDKVMGIIFPVTAFVAAGFEHSIANIYIFAMGFFLQGDVSIVSHSLSFGGVLHNIIPVVLGNIVGGGVFVGLTYWVIYQRDNTALSAKIERGMVDGFNKLKQSVSNINKNDE